MVNQDFPMSVECMKNYAFTPLQEQIIETLVARHRLGEQHFVISRNRSTTAALDFLYRCGVVRFESGGTYWNANLTCDGKDAFFASDYQAPVIKENKELKEQIKGLKAALRAAYAKE